MIVNPEKFQTIILHKQKHDYSNEIIKFDNKTVNTVSSVRLLGIKLDDKLNFRLHGLSVKNRNGESGNGMKGMMGMRGIRVGMWGFKVGVMGMRGIWMRMMGMQGIGVGMWRIRVGTRGIGVGMRGVRVGMRGTGVGMGGIGGGNEDDQGENLRVRVKMMNKKHGAGKAGRAGGGR